MEDIRKRYSSGVRSNGSLTCPQCGAPIIEEKCSYCGVLFYDFACIDTNKPFFMKIKHDDNIYIYKVKMDQVQVTCQNDETRLYSDDIVYSVIPSQHVDINLNFHMVE